MLGPVEKTKNRYEYDMGTNDQKVQIKAIAIWSKVKRSYMTVINTNS